MMMVVVFAIIITAFSFTLLDTSLLDSDFVQKTAQEAQLLAFAEGSLEWMIRQIRENPENLVPLTIPEEKGIQSTTTVEKNSDGQFRIRVLTEFTNRPQFFQKELEVLISLTPEKTYLLERKESQKNRPATSSTKETSEKKEEDIKEEEK